MRLRRLLPITLLGLALTAGAAAAQTTAPPPNGPPTNGPPPTTLPPPTSGGPITGCDRACKPEAQFQNPLAAQSPAVGAAAALPDLTLPPSPPDQEAERQVGGLPITGSGNEDLWIPAGEPKS